MIQSDGGEAEFNPVLRHHLNQLYDIRLPETVDLTKTTISEIHADILAQIRRSEPAVELRLLEKAAIRMVRQKALQRMQQYQLRKPTTVLRPRSSAGLPSYSYAQDDYRLLGRALFELWVRPRELPQRFEAGAAPGAGVRQPHMSEVVEAEERLGFMLEESAGHRYAWDLDLTQVTLANFNYRKMSLVRDYAQLLDDPAENPAFDRVFSIEPREVDTVAPAPLAPGELWGVVNADATQNAAVALARGARSFIIQGPPGTGKSQTITNLIADYTGRGKRVLFVCEKRAALDVVFHRLKQSRLDPLCCLIHDSQTDKKAFIADLKACYEQWIAQPAARDALQEKRDALIDTLAAQQQVIDAFEAAMAQAPEQLGSSVRALLRRAVTLPAAPEVGPVQREMLPALADRDRQRELLQRLHRAMRERFGLESLAAHPFARLSAALVADERAFGRAEQLCEETAALFDALDPLLDHTATLIGSETALAEACRIALDCQRLIDTGLAAHLGLFEPGSPAQAALHAMRNELAQRAETLAAAEAATANWRDKLSAEDTESALALTRRLQGSVLRWLQPAWWRLRGELQRRYDFTRHAVQPGYEKVLVALAEEHAAAALATKQAESRKQYGVADMSAFLDALAVWEQRLQAGAEARHVMAHLKQAIDPVAAARMEAGARDALDKLAQRTRWPHARRGCGSR